VGKICVYVVPLIEKVLKTLEDKAGIENLKAYRTELEGMDKSLFVTQLIVKHEESLLYTLNHQKQNSVLKRSEKILLEVDQQVRGYKPSFGNVKQSEIIEHFINLWQQKIAELVTFVKGQLHLKGLEKMTQKLVEMQKQNPSLGIMQDLIVQAISQVNLVSSEVKMDHFRFFLNRVSGKLYVQL
jgi:hypothetical protein